jgi:hypothetical protein
LRRGGLETRYRHHLDHIYFNRIGLWSRSLYHVA